MLPNSDITRREVLSQTAFGVGSIALAYLMGQDQLRAEPTGKPPENLPLDVHTRRPHFEPGEAVLGADWPGGFFCPCHGSRFDLSGRVFEGSPASANLRVPVYSYTDANTLVIGVDAAPANDADKKGAA